MKLYFDNFEIEESLYDLVSEYCSCVGIQKPLSEHTKGEMNELIEEVFDYYKTGFNCYEPIRAKIRNQLTPVVNAIALLEHLQRTNQKPSWNEIDTMTKQLKYCKQKLLDL